MPLTFDQRNRVLKTDENWTVTLFPISVTRISLKAQTETRNENQDRSDTMDQIVDMENTSDGEGSI